MIKFLQYPAPCSCFGTEFLWRTCFSYNYKLNQISTCK